MKGKCPYCKNDQYVVTEKLTLFQAGRKVYDYQVVCYGCNAKGPQDAKKSTAEILFFATTLRKNRSNKRLRE